MRSLLVAFLLVEFVSSGAEVSISRGVLRPEGLGAIEIRYAAQDSQVAALQFDIGYDAANLNISVVAGPAAQAAGKTITSADLAPGIKRIILAGLNQTVLGDGVIASVVATSGAPGSYELQLTAALGASKDGEPVAISTGNGTVSVELGSPFPVAGAFGHILSGGQWQTTLTLVNASTEPTTASLSFWNNDGQPLALPLVLPDFHGARAAVSSFVCPLGPGATVVIDNEGPEAPQVLAGWVELQAQAPESVFGFATLRFRVDESRDIEATLPLEVRRTSVAVLPYDNSLAMETGIAITNYSADGPAELVLSVNDQAGNPLSSGSLTLPPRGRSFFLLTQQFPAALARRGTIEVRNSTGTPIGVVGLRFSRFGSFSSIPAIPR